MDPARIVAGFARYMAAGDLRVTRAMFEQNLAQKQHDPTFNADLGPMLAHGYSGDFAEALALVQRELVARLPGEPWVGGS